MTGGDDSSSTGTEDDPPRSVSSGRAMGIRRLGTMLKKARGTMSQKTAAQRWGVALATLAAIERGQDRNYQSQTLAPYDAVLGESAWDIYRGPDDPVGAGRAEIDALRIELRTEMAAQVAGLRAEIAALAETRSRPPGVASLLEDMSADEVAAVAAFVHLIVARRPPSPN